ncbi:MAG: 30S ribosomal protein S9 [Candidatus Diapherotrites archaeon]|uniref:30S ribosomal protein S9 n=1 Tax=Candidatus Iainarchaeum sp. TaxID=3101447 RepID=A0A938YYU7_9ARCH|nr:30S ribosomal protein S9 [Candidatus Diapherotrites archaeon]
MQGKKKKKRKTGINSKAKKKMAVARATIKKGTGKIKINNRGISVFQPAYLKRFIGEPLEMAPAAKEVDIKVKVKGGGFMGQAAAARSAIAKALVQYSKDNKLRAAFLAYDRMLLVDDVRRVESKKPLGTKARKKKQKSKR